MKVYLLMWLVCGAVCWGAYLAFNYIDRRAIRKLARDLVDKGEAAPVLEGKYWMFDTPVLSTKRTERLQEEVRRIVKERYVES